jgi:hypothetical protein
LDYDYHELTVGRAPDAQKIAAAAIYGALGARCIAIWSPLLGYPSDRLLVLAAHGAPARAIVHAPGVTGGASGRVSSTLRPADGATPAPLGVYVHNWFTIDNNIDEFVRLSGEAWPDFEAAFETRIFGLFVAEATDADRELGVRRMLLMTGYRDLGEWQKSRSPQPAARAAFQRRRELTRVSLARSCILVPRPGAQA